MQNSIALRLVYGVVATAVSIGAQATVTRDVPRFDIQTFALPNGLEVILSEDHRLPIVAVNVWYHVGPANEPVNRTGFAHLFEHMMFQGSKHVPADAHFRLLEGAGATDISGTTDFDRTNYFETVPSNQLELALWLESDRMGYLIDRIDQASLSNQQDVVRNERRQSHENRPYGLVEDANFRLLFPSDHPYHANIVGSHADIQAATLVDVREFARTYYRPNNATIAIVGDIDKAATRKLVEKYFGSLKPGAPVERGVVPTPPLTAERRAVVTDRIELPRVYMTWLTPASFTSGDANANIASGVLGGGRSGRLYRRLVQERQIAQAVNIDQNSMQLTSLFEIQVTARPGHTLEEVEAALNEELLRFRQEGPTQTEVDRARSLREMRTFQALQRLGGFNGRADMLNRYNHHVGTPDYLVKDIEAHRAVTPLSVRRFAWQYFADNARVVIHAVPGPKELSPDVASPVRSAGDAPESLNESEAWRTRKPNPASSPALRLPRPRSFTLSNGLTVFLVEQRSVPLITATLFVRGGSEANPPQKAGLANFVAAMLTQGTTTRTTLQLADDAAQLGATITTNATFDASSATITTLPRHFDAALQLVADVVRHPAFPASEFEQQRQSWLANLAQRQANPDIVATAVAANALYGPSHPYGANEFGTSESARTIGREDLLAFWKERFVPGNAALVVAGAITPLELRRSVEASFGSWLRGAAPSTPLGDVQVRDQPRLIVVDRPAAPQTQVRISSIGVSRSNPDYVALRVMNDVLGGLFSSRINMNLREARGYTYGARSQFAFRRGAGPFQVTSAVRSDATSLAVQEVFNELHKIRNTVVAEEELNVAKASFSQSLPSAFETTESAITSTAEMFIYGLPPDYFVTLPARISAVSPADVQRVARRYLVPESMVVVAVGDRARIAPPLEAQFGAAQIRNADASVEGRRD